jgi:hypothetical protein
MEPRKEQIDYSFMFAPRVEGLAVMEHQMVAKVRRLPGTVYGWGVDSIRLLGVERTVTGRVEGQWVELPREGFVTGHLFDAVVEFLEANYAQTLQNKVKALESA